MFYFMVCLANRDLIQYFCQRAVESRRSFLYSDEKFNQMSAIASSYYEQKVSWQPPKTNTKAEK